MNATVGVSTQRALPVWPGVAAFLLAAIVLPGCGHGSKAPPDDLGTVTSGENAESATTTRSEFDDVSIAVPSPTAEEPVTAAARLVPAPGASEELIRLVVQVRLAPGWHIYAADAPAGLVTPTGLTIDPPEGVELRGDWILPPARRLSHQTSGMVGYEGNARFAHDLHLQNSSTLHPLTVTCQMTYQACNAAICLAPKSLELRAELESRHRPNHP